MPPHRPPAAPFHTATPPARNRIVVGLVLLGAGALAVRSILRALYTPPPANGADAPVNDQRRRRVNLRALVGVDLGTLSARVAAPVLDANGAVSAVRVLANTAGDRATPAYVGVQRADAGADVLVGVLAKRLKQGRADAGVFGLKHLLGRPFADPVVQAVLELNRLRGKADAGGQLLLELGGRTVRPVELAGEWISHLRLAAADALGSDVTHAVVSVPVSYPDTAIEALRTACYEGGLDLLGTVRDPLAAVLADRFALRAAGAAQDALPARYLVFDGGASARAAVVGVDAATGAPELLTSQEQQLFDLMRLDSELVRSVVVGFAREHNIDLATDPLALPRVQDACEAARVELSSKVQTTINVPYITADAKGPKHLRVDLTRAQFERIVHGVLQTTYDVCRDALARAPGPVERVLATGAAARMPKIEAIVSDVAKGVPSNDGSGIAPEEYAVIGATLEGVRLAET